MDEGRYAGVEGIWHMGHIGAHFAHLGALWAHGWTWWPVGGLELPVNTRFPQNAQ
jgi:hypothetical protein